MKYIPYLLITCLLSCSVSKNDTSIVQELKRSTADTTERGYTVGGIDSGYGIKKYVDEWLNLHYYEPVNSISSSNVFKFSFKSEKPTRSDLCLYNSYDSLVWGTKIKVWRNKNKIVINCKYLPVGEYYLHLDTFINQKIVKL